jgi:hypothetical protein
MTWAADIVRAAEAATSGNGPEDDFEGLGDPNANVNLNDFRMKMFAAVPKIQDTVHQCFSAFLHFDFR